MADGLGSRRPTYLVVLAAGNHKRLQSGGISHDQHVSGLLEGRIDHDKDREFYGDSTTPLQDHYDYHKLDDRRHELYPG